MSSLCSVGDCNVPSLDTTLCGTGSSFLHVTFVPVFMLRLFGTKLMPFILTVASSPPALTPLLIFSTGAGVGCTVCCAQLARSKSVIVRIKIVTLRILTSICMVV